MECKSLGKHYSIKIILLLLLCSCSPKIVTVTEYKERINVEFIRDSIYQKDSIFIFGRNDTIFKTNTKYIYRDRIVKDSVRIVDSIPYEVIVPIDKIIYKTKWHEDILIYLGIASILILLVKTIKRKIWG